MTVLDAPATPAPAGRAASAPPVVPAPDPWLTATVRPVGSFGRQDAGRLSALLGALSACASILVLDLGSARLRSRRAAAAVDDAAVLLEARGGCLLCVYADDQTRACLVEAGTHAVLIEGDLDFDIGAGRAGSAAVGRHRS